MKKLRECKKIYDQEGDTSLRDSSYKEPKINLELLKTKRTRVSSNLSFSKNEEEKMLKYALKMSEEEYKKNRTKSNSKIEVFPDQKPKSFKELPFTPTFEAQDFDFLDFSKYVELCWNSQSNDTGIFKISPPQKWVENYDKSYGTVVDEVLKSDSRKYMFRIQKLSELYKAQVSFIRLCVIFRNSNTLKIFHTQHI